VKRLVFHVIPDFTTRLAALKRGEVDIAYLLGAEELLRTPGLAVKVTLPATHWLYFADQRDPKSQWHDRCLRLAANYANDRHALNQALIRGLSRITWHVVL
jgi:peptide/nickel transport system substrate-binding protein